MDEISTSSGGTTSAVATPRTIASLSASPCAPVATLAFFETVTMARAWWSATLRRLTCTDAPAKRLWVKRPAAAQGASDAITEKSSVVSLMPTLATWVRKPSGVGVRRSGFTADSLAAMHDPEGHRARNRARCVVAGRPGVFVTVDPWYAPVLYP